MIFLLLSLKMKILIVKVEVREPLCQGGKLGFICTPILAMSFLFSSDNFCKTDLETYILGALFVSALLTFLLSLALGRHFRTNVYTKETGIVKFLICSYAEETLIVFHLLLVILCVKFLFISFMNKFALFVESPTHVNHIITCLLILQLHLSIKAIENDQHLLVLKLSEDDPLFEKKKVSGSTSSGSP